SAQTFPSHGVVGSGSATVVPALSGRLLFSGSLESRTPAPMAAAGTFTGLAATVAAAPGTGKSWTITLRLNGADTALAVTIANAATTGTSSGSVAVVAGDLVSYSVAASG